MEVLENIGKKTKRDADGYENIDQFWQELNVLRYPLSDPIERYLSKCSDEYMSALTGNKFGTDPGNSTDDEFLYDDDESITVNSEIESVASDDDNAAPVEDVSIALSPLSSKKGNKSRSSNASTKNTLSESLPLDDTLNTSVNTRGTSRSGVNNSKYNADVSLNDVSAITTGTIATPKSVANQKGGKRSSVGLNNSEISVQPASSVDSGSPQSTSLSSANTHNTSIPGSNYKNSSRGSRSNNTTATTVNNTTIRSESEEDITLQTPSTRGSGRKATPNTLESGLSMAFSGGNKTPGDRRVTFGSMPALSPIDSSTPNVGSSGKRGHRFSVGSINDPSTDISAASSSHNQDYYDDGGFDNEGGNFDDPQDERIQSIVSDIHTPLSTNKSKSRSSVNTGSTGRSSSSKSRSAVNTPDSFHLSDIATPKTGEIYKGYKLPDESYRPEDDEIDTDREEDASNLLSPNDKSYDMNESTLTNGSFLHTISNKNPKYVGSKLGKKRKGLYTSDEDENDDLGINSDDDSEEDKNVRRSSRATKGQKFAFWKNERPIYEHGTLVGVSEASKTPKKAVKSAVASKRSHKSSKSNKKLFVEDSSDAEEKPVAVPIVKEERVKLPKDVKFIKREEYGTIQTWNESKQDVVEELIIRRSEDLTLNNLPVGPDRPANKNVNCLAVQSLSYETAGNMSSWVAGHVVMPPKAIKDEERVGSFSMIFTLTECQDGAVELGIADPDSADWVDGKAQRMLLKKGDSFHIPPGNIYRLENHSSSVSATVYFTIIKPIIFNDQRSLNNSEMVEAE